jgi:hypothetical protein
MYFYIDDMNDDDIMTVLKQAIMGVEKGFFDSIGDKLVEKTLIDEEIAVSIVVIVSTTDDVNWHFIERVMNASFL